MQSLIAITLTVADAEEERGVCVTFVYLPGLSWIFGRLDPQRSVATPAQALADYNGEVEGALWINETVARSTDYNRELLS